MNFIKIINIAHLHHLLKYAFEYGIFWDNRVFFGRKDYFPIEKDLNDSPFFSKRCLEFRKTGLTISDTDCVTATDDQFKDWIYKNRKTDSSYGKRDYSIKPRSWKTGIRHNDRSNGL